MHQDREPLPGICLALRSWWLGLPQHSRAKRVLLTARCSSEQLVVWNWNQLQVLAAQKRRGRAEGHPCSAVLAVKAPVT